MTAHRPSPVHPVDLAVCGSEEERKLRLRLHKARDVAGRRAEQSQTGPGARAIYLLAADAAGAWIFRAARIDQLQDAIELVTRLFQAAAPADRLEASDGE